MPKSIKYNESDLLKACEAARAQKKPNISKIAREYGVPVATLRDRHKHGRQPRTAQKPVNKALEGYQEEALIQWIVWMRDHNLPVTPKLLEEYANQALQRAGKDRQVSKVWAYRFEKRLPEHLNLGPIKQKTKESKRIQAEDAGLLAHWYNQLANVVKKDTPARLVYNFDECGFRPGEGRSRKVIGSKGAIPNLPESERGENITAIECISADGWQMDPWFIFKGKLLLFYIILF
jgi:transposase-like protein